MSHQPDAEHRDEAIARAAYELLAEPYAALVDTKPHNAFYERPALLSLLPEPAGLRAVDAGCGPGFYAGWLAERGATVTAFDVSPTMVRLARERLGAGVQVVEAGLEAPLDFLASAAFDLLICGLALDYARDWGAVFREFARVLRPGGVLAFSCSHPLADFQLHSAGNYFAVEKISVPWSSFGPRVYVPTYRRPLGAIINSLLAAGFVLEQLLEPKPTAEFRAAAPDEHHALSRRPGFLCVRGRRC
jgi:SAM-dependent methyltransferase